jgi:hypothetical protein
MDAARPQVDHEAVAEPSNALEMLVAHPPLVTSKDNVGIDNCNMRMGRRSLWWWGNHALPNEMADEASNRGSPRLRLTTWLERGDERLDPIRQSPNVATTAPGNKIGEPDQVMGKHLQRTSSVATGNEFADVPVDPFPQPATANSP